jgi:hypothetical protein
MEPTIEELGAIAASNRVDDPDDGMGWLAKLIATPPAPATDQEIAMDAQSERQFMAGKLLARLPTFVRGQTAQALERHIRHPQMLDVARTWMPESGSLMAMGTTGQGKTTMLGSIALRLIDGGVRGGGRLWELAQGLRWYRAEELERAQRAHPLGKGESKEYIAAINAKVLMFDELGWEKDHRLVASVLAARYDSAQLTLCTTGLPMKELREIYGDAIMRRVLTYKGRRGVMVDGFPPEPRPAGPVNNPKPPTEVG